MSVVAPRSFCPACERQIPWYLNLPLVSWLMLRGRCRWCGKGISARYFAVELLVGVLFLMAWLKYDLGASPRLLALSPVEDWRLVPVFWVAISGLVLGTFVDFEHLIIPDRVTLGGIVAGLALSAVLPALHEETTILRSLLWSSTGAAAGWGLLWATAALGKAVFKKEAMGFGDVKLMGAIGAFFGTRAVFFTIMFSSLFGSIVGISLVIFGGRKMQSRIPYGPYLALAALAWLFWGPYFWNVYVSLMTPKPF
jgi:leader peptidase (prepilin peptidase)/N-methyltransferase